MSITTILACGLIGSYFVIERWLRKGEKALSLQAGESDRGSTKALLISGTLSIALVLIAPILNTYQVGTLKPTYLSWMGLLLMLSGLALRAWAAKTLGEFYTRTLQIVEGQPLIDKAPYRVIRHPGYLGIFLMGIGAGLAILNWVALLGGVVVGACSRVYRICSEAVMLKTTFGEQHEAYSAKNWRLLPFIY